MVADRIEPIQNDAQERGARSVRKAATLTLVLAAVAAVALVAAPHAYLVDDSEDGTTTELRFWWDQLALDAETEAVAGAAALYGAIGATVLVVGAVLVFFAVQPTARDAPARRGLLLGGLATFLAGALATLHYASLWTSRLLTTVVHAVAGFDAPPAIMRLPDFPADAYSYAWVLGPAAVLGLVLAAAFVLVRALPDLAVGAHDQRPQARRHLRAGALGLLVLALAFVLPWSVQDLPDNQSDWEGVAPDDDSFWFGAYDAARMNQGTTAVSQDVNEDGLIQYEELGQVLDGVLLATLLALAAAVTGFFGTLRGADGDRNLGNLWQSTAYAGIVANGILFLAVSLGALWLHRPNADLPDTGAYLPLAALAPVVLGLLGQLQAVRTVGGENATLLADDFPEPIVYD